MDFDITKLSMSISAAKTTGDVGMAVLAKTMDTQEQLGDNLVNMIDAAAMERSVNPGVGGNVDAHI